MRAAGFADLRSRPVSVADWYLSHRLLDTAWDAAALRLVADRRHHHDRVSHGGET